MIENENTSFANISIPFLKLCSLLKLLVILFITVYCPFQKTFKVLKDNVNTFSCNVFIEHCHNHAVNYLEALSFEMLSTEIKIEIGGTIFFWFNSQNTNIYKLKMNF